MKKLQWSKDARPMNWYQAVKHAENLKEGGFDDWRLPTVKELISLVNFDKVDPASDESVESSNYWSSTARADNSNLAWSVDFDSGDMGYSSKRDTYYVRYVRDAQSTE